MPAGRGASDEKTVLRRHLQADRCYVLERGFAQFKLLGDIVHAGSSYVCRIRDHSAWEVNEPRPLCEEAIAAGVVQDAVVRLGSTKAGRAPDHPLRVVVVKKPPHARRGGRKGKSAGPASDGRLRLATNLLDLPAELVALIYRYRWSIELFFRFFKHVLGGRHLLSQSPQGIAIQVYGAVIACMLISLWTGRKPTLRTQEMLCYYLMGWATEDELLAHVEKLKMQTP